MQSQCGSRHRSSPTSFTFRHVCDHHAGRLGSTRSRVSSHWRSWIHFSIPRSKISVVLLFCGVITYYYDRLCPQLRSLLVPYRPWNPGILPYGPLVGMVDRASRAHSKGKWCVCSFAFSRDVFLFASIGGLHCGKHTCSRERRGVAFGSSIGSAIEPRNFVVPWSLLFTPKLVVSHKQQSQ